MQGQLLNSCREPKQWHLYGAYVSDVTNSLYQKLELTYSQTLTSLPPL